MLLKQNLRLYRVLKMTWKIDLLMLAVCTAAYYVDITFFPYNNLPSPLPTLLGTAIAFFVAFNNNQAYSRWWEARTIWGALVNDSRSYARNLLAYSNYDESIYSHRIVRKMILRHIGFLYCLKAVLRKQKDDSYKKFLTEEDIKSVETSKNIPNALLNLQANDLQELTQSQQIDEFRFLTINDLIRSFCDSMGQSERIANTVFPTTYIYFTRLFIWILVALTTMTTEDSLGLVAILFGWLIGFVFHSTHINGMSLMNPFELEPACVPLNSIIRNIEINLLEALGEQQLPEPEKTVRNGEYIL